MLNPAQKVRVGIGMSAVVGVPPVLIAGIGHPGDTDAALTIRSRTT